MCRTIQDDDAPEVADIFYRHLFRNGRDSIPDPTEAAYALYLAMKLIMDSQQHSEKYQIK